MPSVVSTLQVLLPRKGAPPSSYQVHLSEHGCYLIEFNAKKLPCEAVKVSFSCSSF